MDDAPTTSEAKRVREIALLSILCYVAFSVCIPLIRLPRLHGHAMHSLVNWSTLATTFLFMFLQLWLPRSLVALKMKAGAALGAAAICAVCWLGLFSLLAHARMHHHPMYSLDIVVGATGAPVALTVGLSCLGLLLSRIIREVNVLLPVAFIAMPIDYIGAMTPTGYTADMVRHHPSVVQSVSVGVPVFHGVAPIGFIGPGDVLFVAFFLAVVQNLELNTKGTFWLMFALLTATMIVVTILGVNVAALVPMGFAVLIANFRYFHLRRSEVFATIYATLIVLALATAFFVYSHHHFFPAHGK